jgi:hypothetical protein
MKLYEKCTRGRLRWKEELKGRSFRKTEIDGWA